MHFFIGSILSLSCSFGVSSYQALDNSDTLIKRADDALYMAKENGRNGVVVAKGSGFNNSRKSAL